MIYSLDLDITPNGVPQIVKLSQYDKTMPTLVITLYNGSQVFTIPTGCTAYIEGTKADKTGFQYPCTVSGGVINATITEQMTAFAGRVPCEIVLRKSGERKGSANFFLDIEPSALSDDTVISDSDLPIIQQMPEYAQSCADDAELAHKWATFGSDSETPSATNNAKYWAEQAEAVTGVGDLMTTRSKLGAKNLLPNNLGSQVIKGVTITVNDADGSINCNGTATGGDVNVSTGSLIFEGTLPVGTYIFTSGQQKNFQGVGLAYKINNGTAVFVIGEKTFSISDGDTLKVWLYAQNGYGWDDFTYYPMIRLATDHDSTYQPYAMTNKELTKAIAQLNTDLTSIKTVSSSYSGTSLADMIKDIIPKMGFTSTQQKMDCYTTWNGALWYIRLSLIGYGNVVRYVGDAYGYGSGSKHSFVYGSGTSVGSVDTVSIA